MKKNNPLLGAHTSIAKGIHNSLYHAKELEATTTQIFTANQRQWQAKPIAEEDVEKFIQAKKETQISIILSHGSYLINLGSSKKNLLNLSRKAFKEEIQRCHLLKINYLVFHPGSFIETTLGKCLDTIAESLILLSPIIKKGKTLLLLETTAGQGNNAGYKFEQLAYIINKVKNKIPIGVCIDTCHIFSAGYDIRTKESCKNIFLEFSKIVGLKYLHAFHLNDSKNDLGSRKDRHEKIGHGKIGFECFKYIMKEKKFFNMPKILETPQKDLWKKEIKLLKEFSK